MFFSAREGRLGLYEKDAAGATPSQLLLGSDTPLFPADWSTDGALVSYTKLATDTSTDLWLLPMAGDRQPTVGIPHALFQAAFRQNPPQRNSYDVTGDGERFLVNTMLEGALSAPITWVLNWTAELEP